MIALWDFFSDPVLRGPTWGTFLMCIASSLIGVILLLQRRSLLAESLSHAAYPGIVIGLCVFTLLFPECQDKAFFAVLLGALTTSFLGFKAIEWLEKRGKVHSDAALCFTLAVFFGVGAVAASIMQFTCPSSRNQLNALLFGQAATMSDIHVFLYAILTLAIVLFIGCAFRPLQAVLFDHEYAKTSSISVAWIERAVFWLFLFALILGIRSVGIVLMSGMAIAPAIAARQFTDRLQTLFLLASFFGGVSGLCGNILSVEGTVYLSQGGEKLTLPTGPAIILCSAAIAILALLFAPKRGLVFRVCRMIAFQLRCAKENLLKSIWKNQQLSFQEIKRMHRISSVWLVGMLWHLKRGGWLAQRREGYCLTPDGFRKAVSIVRLHRLWELYLVSELGVSKEKIHPVAEEMEHILTPEIEEQLTRLFAHSKEDPHGQPIPDRIFL